MFVVLILFFTTLLNAVGGTSDVSIEQGRFQYEVLKVNTVAPRFGTCWQQALEDLHNGCRDLTDDVQAKLALSFANCFLLKSGMRTYDCSRDLPVSECLRDIDNNAFTAYSNFFTHTHNMCQFLQAQVWRQRTEDTIMSLTENSAKVADDLQQSAKIQDIIVQNQLQTLEYQQQIMENGSVLSRAIEMSRSNVREMLQEFRSSTDEQRALIFSIFDRVAKLQNLVISEVSWIYTMMFYGVSMLGQYLVTATKRTAEARLPLFTILSVNLALERMVCTMSLPADFDLVDEIPERISERIWLLRKTSLLVCCIVILYFSYTFKDYNVINNRLLQDICKQNRELCQAIELIKQGHNMTNDHTDSAFLSIGHNVIQDESDDGNESDTNSFDSTQSDRTWRDDIADPLDGDGNDEYDEDLDDSDEELVEDYSLLSDEFYTAASNSPIQDSGTTTPSTFAESVNFDPTLLSTPSKQAPDILNRSCHDLMMPTVQPNSGQMKVRKSSRRGGWCEDSRPSTPIHQYNLRRRISNFDNPILDSETPNSFGKLVSHLSHITQKHSLLIRQKCKVLQMAEDSKIRSPPNSVSAYSSDEEN